MKGPKLFGVGPSAYPTFGLYPLNSFYFFFIFDGMTAKTSDRESRLKINQFMFISKFLKTCVLSGWTYNQ